MINSFKNKSINQVTKITMVFTAFVTLFITFILFLNTYSEHLKNLTKVENEYVKSQKDLIKSETERAIKYITYLYDASTETTNVKNLQDHIVKTIENITNTRDGSGYIFIYTFDGINIADPILKYNAGKNLIDFKDPNGKLVIKELIDISQKKDGGFVNYVWNKPITNKLTDKISYATSFKPWNWMIGSGVYLDDIQNVIKQKKIEYKQKIVEYILQILMFTVALYLSTITVSKYFTFLIQKDINQIKDTLRHVSVDYKNIDMTQIRFKEFKQISFNANLMINELKDLNANLENKVEQRTEKLQKSEEFAHDLVESQDKFIKNAIHEINTPLSIIITNIDLFKLKYDENRYLSKIEAGSKIIHNIYNDLAYLMKKDRIEYVKQQINFSQFLEFRIDFFEEIAKGNNIILKCDIQKNIFINFNDTQLQRICDNNLSNAIKYSFENTVIDISLKKEKENIILSIKNSGETIKEPEKLFERYYRENDIRGGFGLGLNIIDDICKSTNTSVEIESNNNKTIFRYIFKNEDKTV